jgi:hypothetical protein
LDRNGLTNAPLSAPKAIARSHDHREHTEIDYALECTTGAAVAPDGERMAVGPGGAVLSDRAADPRRVRPAPKKFIGFRSRRHTSASSECVLCSEAVPPHRVSRILPVEGRSARRSTFRNSSTTAIPVVPSPSSFSDSPTLSDRYERLSRNGAYFIRLRTHSRAPVRQITGSVKSFIPYWLLRFLDVTHPGVGRR